MKNVLFTSLISFFALCAPIYAQLPSQPDTLLPTTSSLLFFGKMPLHENEAPIEKKQIIPKLELLGLFQKQLTLGLELPINYNTSFILGASRKVLNTSEPQQTPGTYTHTYTKTEFESSTLLFFTTHQTTTTPAPYNEWGGNFLPTTIYAFQPKIRSYFRKKSSGNRFYCAPGIIVQFLSGVSNQDYRTVLNSSTHSDYGDFLVHYSTTTTTTYQETRVVKGGEKRVTGGLTLGFGYQANAGKRIVFDFSLEAVAKASKHWRGMKPVSVLPQVQVGYRI